MTVVLPAPFGPRSPKVSPASTVMFTLSAATTDPNLRVRSCVSRMLTGTSSIGTFRRSHQGRWPSGGERRPTLSDLSRPDQCPRPVRPSSVLASSGAGRAIAHEWTCSSLHGAPKLSGAHLSSGARHPAAGISLGRASAVGERIHIPRIRWFLSAALHEAPSARTSQHADRRFQLGGKVGGEARSLPRRSAVVDSQQDALEFHA